MDDEMQAIDAGTFELGHRLEAYARARLSPDPRATARTRARVMREARLSFDGAGIAIHVAPAIAASASCSPASSSGCTPIDRRRITWETRSRDDTGAATRSG